jgi:hypothetical protein
MPPKAALVGLTNFDWLEFAVEELLEDGGGG